MSEYSISEGMSCPFFNLLGSDNIMHNTSDYAGKKIILYFYPKDNTSG